MPLGASPDFCSAEGGGSIGRAAVSKTAGCRFESCPPCEARTGAERKVRMVSSTSADAAENVVERAERDRKQARGPFSRIWLFLRQVVGELRQVVTPTRRELVLYFVGVLVFIVIMVLILGGLDFGFGKLVMLVFGKAS